MHAIDTVYRGRPKAIRRVPPSYMRQHHHIPHRQKFNLSCPLALESVHVSRRKSRKWSIARLTMTRLTMTRERGKVYRSRAPISGFFRVSRQIRYQSTTRGWRVAFHIDDLCCFISALISACCLKTLERRT
jgi:hypothetical protein